MLAFENFSKTYPGGKRAVDRLSLSVDAGDIYGFIGHNGAGKTTAIRAAVGALGFEEGEIRIGGMSVQEEPVACKAITAYIPDNPELYDYLTGMQYINFIADVFGVAEAERQQRIARYATAFEMEESLGGLIVSYSHGMKQKTALIAALVHAPKLLILDEPFVGLDPKASHTLKGMMRELCDAGAAIFFSTHVLEVAEKLCNKIAIIKNGRLVAAGETGTVKGDHSLEDVFMELIDA